MKSLSTRVDPSSGQALVETVALMSFAVPILVFLARVEIERWRLQHCLWRGLSLAKKGTQVLECSAWAPDPNQWDGALPAEFVGGVSE